MKIERFVAIVSVGLIVTMFCRQGGAACLGNESARDLANRDTVGIVSGSVRGTYARFAQDMADALDIDCELRVVAMLGRGSVQNIADLLWLRGVDLAIVQSDVFNEFLNRSVKGVSDIRTKVRYLMKLYNEEVHILAHENIVNMRDLNDKTVSIGGRGSGTSATARTLFSALEIPVNAVNMKNSEAVAAVRAGEISAAVFVAGKPASYFSQLQPGEPVHFLRVEIDRSLEAKGYISSKLLQKDYPNVVQGGTGVETIAVGAIMAVYNWKKTSSRYNRTTKFAKRLIANLKQIKSNGAYHPKWAQVDPYSRVPGWTRFEPVEELLRR